MNKIVFFLETKIPIGDNQFIFLDLAAYLAENTDIEIYYINNYFKEDANRNLSNKLHFCTPEEFDFEAAGDAVYFTPVNYLMHLIVRIRNCPYAKVCLYQYSNQALEWLSRNMDYVCSQKAIDDFINEYDARAYFNLSCVGRQVSFKNNNEIVFLPNVLGEKCSYSFEFRGLIDRDRINIGLLGPLNSETVYTLYNLFANFQISQNNKKTDIHIIGKSKIFLNDVFKKSSSNRTRIIFTGELNKENRKNYINKNVDMVLANSSYAIEAATCAVPVILPVSQNKPYVGNNYVYLFDAKGYKYNLDYSSLIALGSISHPLSEILDDIYIYDKKEKLARDCYKYCAENNALEVVSSKFLDFIESSKLYLKDCLCENWLAECLKRYDNFVLNHNISGYAAFLDAKEAIKRI